MTQNHPLLSAVDTMNVAGLTESFYSTTDAGAAATWGTVTDAIATEIASGFKKIELSQNKLSAFMPISMGMLDLGPVWLDTYIRTCLSEALALGYENAIVTGTGNNMPIGMDRSVADDVTVTGGVYPQKNAIAVTDFGRASYGNLVAQLAKTQYGKARAVTGACPGMQSAGLFQACASRYNFDDTRRPVRQQRFALPDNDYSVGSSRKRQGHPRYRQELLPWRSRWQRNPVQR